MRSICDLHTHSIVSGHAYSTLQENIAVAREVGLSILGTSEHTEGMPGSTANIYFRNMKVLPRKIQGVYLLRGAEANIIDYEGNIDIEGRSLKHLDYVIASLHEPCISFGTIEENTKAILGAMKQPKVKIIGHPDDSRYPIDQEVVVKAAKEKGIFLELNNASLQGNALRQGARENLKTLLPLCVEYRVPIILGSDAHVSFDVGKLEDGMKLLKEMRFPEELVLNYSRTAGEFLEKFGCNEFFES